MAENNPLNEALAGLNSTINTITNKFNAFKIKVQ